MAKSRTQFLCNQCGSVHPKWMGKCPDCGTWDSLEEYKAPAADARAAARFDPAQTGDLTRGAEALTLDQIDEAESPRRPTGIGEFDRILGGGVVAGSAVLVGGEPGIGKSTLLLQVAHELARSTGHDKVTRRQGEKVKGRGAGDASSVTLSPPHLVTQSSSTVLYVTSEESARQTKLRAARLGVVAPGLLVLAETNVERIDHERS